MKFSAKIWFALLLLLGWQEAFSQTDTTEYRIPYPHYAFGYPKWAFKWNAPALIDIDATLQIAAERFLGKRWSVQQEIGYGWWNLNSQSNSQNSNPNNNQQPGNDYKTWRFRTEGRYYINNYEESNMGLYVAGEFLYKRVSYPQTQTIGRDCIDGGCNYFQVVDYLYVRRVMAGHFKVGLQSIIGKRFLVDFFAGIGLRYIQVRHEGKPQDDIREYQDYGVGLGSLFNRREIGDYTVPSGTFGLRIGLMTYRPK
jgi:hypothetical protein